MNKGLLIGLRLAWASPTYTLRYNHVLGPNHPYHAGFQRWALRVSERTNGDLQILVFHSAQLGVEEDVIEQLRRGVPVGQNTLEARWGLAPGFAQRLQAHALLYDASQAQFFQAYLPAEEGLFFFEVVERQGYRGYSEANAPIRLAAQARWLRRAS